MRALQMLVLGVPLLASCAAAPVRWAGDAYVVADPPTSAEPQLEARDALSPDCAVLDGPQAVVTQADTASSTSAAKRDDSVGAMAPILRVTSAERAVPPAPAEVLPDHTGAAFYDQVGKHTASLDKFLAVVRPTIPPAEVLDFTRLPRVLTIAVHRQGYRPADRLERVQIIVKAVNFRFVDPQPSGTSFEVADFGHLSEERNLSGTASLSATSAATATSGVSRTDTFERELSRRFQDVDVTVGPRALRVYREGAVGRDLTGALSLQLAVAPTDPDLVFSEQVVRSVRLTTAVGEPAGVDTALLRYIGGPAGAVAPLYACAQLRYLDRRVLTGQNYIDESRQQVAIASGGTPWAAYKIVPAQELRPPLWRIQAGEAVLAMKVPRHARHRFPGSLRRREGRGVAGSGPQIEPWRRHTDARRRQTRSWIWPAAPDRQGG